MPNENPTLLDPATRDLLAVLLAAIDLPHAATVGDNHARLEALEERAMHAAICLRNLLDGRAWDRRPVTERMATDTAYLRERLAELPPLAYTTWDQARAAR